MYIPTWFPDQGRGDQAAGVGGVRGDVGGEGLRDRIPVLEPVEAQFVQGNQKHLHHILLGQTQLGRPVHRGISYPSSHRVRPHNAARVTCVKDARNCLTDEALLIRVRLILFTTSRCVEPLLFQSVKLEVFEVHGHHAAREGDLRFLRQRKG